MSKTKITAALFASAILNTFLLGIVLSFYMMHPEPTPAHPHRPPPPHHKQNTFMQFEHAKQGLSKESIEKIDTILRAHSLKMREDMQEMQELKRTAESILKSPNFDAEALSSAHKNMKQHNATIKHAMSEVIYEIAKILPDEERIKFFEKTLEKRPPPQHR